MQHIKNFFVKTELNTSNYNEDFNGNMYNSFSIIIIGNNDDINDYIQNKYNLVLIKYKSYHIYQYDFCTLDIYSFPLH
jgi:hypothetical protein